MKRIIIMLLALCILTGSALADIETTGNVNLRRGPGKEYSIVATVPKGTVLIDLDSIIKDDRGTEWYWVEYNGISCWISSKYANIIGRAGCIALEGYYGSNLKWAAQDLNLSGYEFTGGELENSYYSSDLAILGNNDVECMSITGSQYTLFGAATGMMWYEALDACVKCDLYVIGANEYYIVLERAPQYPNTMKSCINLYLNEEGKVTEIGWSTYTSD